MQVRGSMLPAELIRPKSFAYVNFQLGAFARLAIQSEALGVDLWRYRSEEKNSIMVCCSQAFKFKSEIVLKLEGS